MNKASNFLLILFDNFFFGQLKCLSGLYMLATRLYSLFEGQVAGMSLRPNTGSNCPRKQRHGVILKVQLSKKATLTNKKNLLGFSLAASLKL